ncbi:GntR family transcriptional regulator [Nocardia sp. NPDC050713]|uniref:GntR family transcriptional regulator n=1 Tax=Nocardia sp. NPDC050713 TaxID=3154511 RepID=UPI0033E12620
MTEPAYVTIAGDYARQIRGGTLAPGAQLPSRSEMVKKHGVSDIVVRQAIELLLSQGLVRTIKRRGVFVTDRPNLVRVSPERQMESPEATFERESAGTIHVERDTERIPASPEIAEALGITAGETVTRVVTRASEDGRPISISDSYQPPSVEGTSGSAFLEETVSDKLPASSHAEWLGTPPGDLVKAVHQRFLASDDRVLMVSEISYPRDRYEAFVFRMTL